MTALAESLVGRHTALERQARWLRKEHVMEVTGSPGIVPWMNGNLRGGSGMSCSVFICVLFFV